MYKIYLDTSERKNTKLRLVKINEDGENIVEDMSGDFDLVSGIREILNKHNLEVSDINEVIPNLGPGSFTGLKVGVTVSNVINWINGKKTPANIDLPNYGRDPNITLKDF